MHIIFKIGLTHKTMEIKQKVGTRINQLRIEKKISITSLAWDSNVDPTYLQETIRGERNISIIKLSQVCTQLEISLHDFFTDPLFQ